MSLSVRVLGCSGTYPGPGGACSGYLFTDGATTVWVDAGSGTLANLQRHVPMEAVDAIVLSHEHPDHWADLEGYYNVCRFFLQRTDVPVYAPAGLRARTYEDTGDHFRWRDVADGDRIAIGGIELRFSRTDHGPETLAMRVEGGGRAVGYSADTGPDWSPVALGPDLDLLLCEATMSSEQEGATRHLSARQAGAAAREAGARRLVLTHLWPTLDPERSRREAAKTFGQPVEAAAVDAAYTV